MEQPRRVQVIQEELDWATDEYVRARDAFQDAQVRFETAREKLAGLKSLAATMMPGHEWIQWQGSHSNVGYVGMSLGDAILSVLQGHAWNRAWEYVNKPPSPTLIATYEPILSKDAIVESLESGGFDFRTTAPLREVHAALIRLEGAKEQDGGTYIASNADEILSMARDTLLRQTLP